MAIKFGFMQGRLSNLVDGQIQAFPWSSWEDEFLIASRNGWGMMEWTLDYKAIESNPINTVLGREKLLTLKKTYNIEVPSLTADFVMQKPFYKCNDGCRNVMLDLLKTVLVNSSLAGVSIFVIPLVDNGSLDSSTEYIDFMHGMEELAPILDQYNIRLAFESDFSPMDLKKLIDDLDEKIFGINYDTGNSASLGYNPLTELALYGKRVINVHIKDRLRGGGTVPIGQGDTMFASVFEALLDVGYQGNYIFQAARSESNDHVGCLNDYRTYIERIMDQAWISG